MPKKPQAPVEEPVDETPEGAAIEQDEDVDPDAEGAGEFADELDGEEGDSEAPGEEDDASGAPEGTEGEPEPDPLQTKAEMWDRLNDQFAADPVALVQSLSKQLPPEKVAALVTLLQQQAAPAPAPAALPEDYEPRSDLEELLVPHVATLANIPGAIQEEIGRYHESLAPMMDSTGIEIMILAAQVDALRELAGITFPQVDRAKVQAALADGKTTFAEAVKKVVGDTLRQQVMLKKQGSKRRPGTPGNEGSSERAYKPGTSLAEIFANEQ